MAIPVQEDKPLRAGQTVTVTQSFIRPNNATAYAAGDVVTTSATADVSVLIPFAGMARNPGGGGVIESALFIDSVAAATKPDLELYLFDTQNITLEADNVAWAITDANIMFCVGVIPFATGAFKTAGANGVIAVNSVGLAYNCASSSTSLYGILIARNAYTPAALEQFTFRLQALLD